MSTITITAEDLDAHAAYRALIARLMRPQCAPHNGWQSAHDLELTDDMVATVVRAVPELFPDGLRLDPTTRDEIADAFDCGDDESLLRATRKLLVAAARKHLFDDLQERCWERDDREYAQRRTAATQAAIDHAYADAVGMRAAGEI